MMARALKLTTSAYSYQYAYANSLAVQFQWKRLGKQHYR